MNPVTLGQYARDERDEEPPPKAPEFCTALCTTCSHQHVCAVALAIKDVEPLVSVGACEAYQPLLQSPPHPLAR